MIDLTVPTSNTFKIRLLFGFSGGPGMISGDTQWFQIWDPANSLSAAYFRGAAGFQTPGLAKLGKLGTLLTSGGGGAAGPWNDFSILPEANVGDFSGAVLMVSAAAGGVAGGAIGRDPTEGFAKFQLRTKRNEDIFIRDFDTGDTYQLAPSIAGTFGLFVIVIWASLFKGGNGGVFRYTG